MKRALTHTTPKSSAGGTNFLISIHHQENHSWQGLIQWLDTGQKVHFRSELEMMNLISKAVQTGCTEAEELRSWEDEQKIQVAGS